jgi:hypothetical protein
MPVEQFGEQTDGTLIFDTLDAADSSGIAGGLVGEEGKLFAQPVSSSPSITGISPDFIAFLIRIVNRFLGSLRPQLFGFSRL